MLTMIISLEREALSICKENSPKESILFCRPSGRPIAIWIISENGDAELFSLSLGFKKKLKLLFARYGEFYRQSRISEKYYMRAMGMNP